MCYVCLGDGVNSVSFLIYFDMWGSLWDTNTEHGLQNKFLRKFAKATFLFVKFAKATFFQ